MNYDNEDKELIKKKLKNNIDDLKRNIKDLKIDSSISPNDLFPDKDTLPGLNMELILYDYEKDIQLIQDDAEETLECISSLYLTSDTMMNKNINRLIKNDAEEISDIKFSLSCAKRGLINCMKQLDAGSNDPDMHTAVNAYQKEIRESNKMIHELLNKMKIFYKNLRDELKVDDEINVGNKELKNLSDNNDLKLIDKSEFNDLIEQYKKDPTLLKDVI
jgi:hypothetical protein